MNNELYHWKYIKREKVGGKWVYTYDKGAAAKKNYQQAKNNLNTRNAQERSARRHNLPSDGVKNVAFNNYTRYQYGDKGVRDKLEKRYKDAKTEYSKSPIAKKEQRADSLKRGAEKVKNWAKDVAGYDEKHAAEVARTKATIKKYEHDDALKKNAEWEAKYVTHDPRTGAAKFKPGYQNVQYWAEWDRNYHRDEAWEANNDALAAEEKYRKTPLGRYEIASEKINAAVELGKQRMRVKLGYLNRDWAEGRKDDVEYYTNKVKEAEKKLEKTRKEHPNAKAAIDYDEKELDTYESMLYDAKKSYEKAHEDYMSTPLGKLSKNEKAYEFVDNMLNGTPKKKRKK